MACSLFGRKKGKVKPNRGRIESQASATKGLGQRPALAKIRASYRKYSVEVRRPTIEPIPGLPGEVFVQRYKPLEEVVGSGGFARVMLYEKILSEEGEDFEDLVEEECDSLRAVKIIKKSKRKKEQERARIEANMMMSLRHKHILRTYGFYEDEDNFYIVMEYLSGGNLFSKLKQIRDFSEKDARTTILCLVNALSYCRDKGISH